MDHVITRDFTSKDYSCFSEATVLVFVTILQSYNYVIL